MSLKKELGRNASPAIRIAVISMILCGLLFPLVVTGFAQVLFPSQADGSIAHLGTNKVGSYLIAQNFSEPYFFQSRNSSLSASGVDPDITLQDAQAQVARISNATCKMATCITSAQLITLINKHIEGTFWIFGYPYVNVLKLNLALIQSYQTVYKQLDPSLFQP
jgi:potassium-transporting ATPase KdpC subunit